MHSHFEPRPSRQVPRDRARRAPGALRRRQECFGEGPHDCGQLDGGDGGHAVVAGLEPADGSSGMSDEDSFGSAADEMGEHFGESRLLITRGTTTVAVEECPVRVSRVAGSLPFISSGPRSHCRSVRVVWDNAPAPRRRTPGGAQGPALTPHSVSTPALTSSRRSERRPSAAVAAGMTQPAERNDSTRSTYARR